LNAPAIDIEDFVQLKAGARTVRVHPQYVESVGRQLLQGENFEASAHTGRGSVARVETEHGPVVIRRYRRGGAIRRFVRDRYFLSDRPAKELRVHCVAWHRGVPTALPVAALSIWQGPWCSGAFATTEIQAPDLLGYLQEHGNGADAGLASCGSAIRAMHDAGVWHADLQVKNLITNGERAWIIDFDRAKARGALHLAKRQHNLQRLRRSFLKLGLDLAWFETLVRAYEAAEGSKS
jgi:3-deoxy-D-manno-octulosonic acid kinase